MKRNKDNIIKDNSETKCLDGLKGIAAFIIAFMWHYQHLNPNIDGTFTRFFPLSYKYGYIMVELFFILSGLGMMIGYCEKIFNHKIDFKEYIKKRIKKIYPIFFLTLILTAIFELIYLRQNGSTFIYGNFDLYHFVLNVLCIQDGIFDGSWSFNSPSWCISICIVLYAILYYVVYHSKDKKEILYKFIFLLCITQLLADSHIINGLLARGVSCFSIGVILYFIYENKKKYNYKLLGWIFITFLTFSYVITRRYNLTYTGDIGSLMKFGIAPCLILAMLYNNILNKVLSFKPLVWLGSISLEIYLFHFPIQCLIKIIDTFFNLNLNYASKKIWIVYVFVTLAISFLYSKFIKKRYNNKFFDILKNKEKLEKVIEKSK